jgi:hypothetical protein
VGVGVRVRVRVRVKEVRIPGRTGTTGQRARQGSGAVVEMQRHYKEGHNLLDLRLATLIHGYITSFPAYMRYVLSCSPAALPHYGQIADLQRACMYMSLYSTVGGIYICRYSRHGMACE